MADAPENLAGGWRRLTAHLGLNASMGAMLAMVVCVGMGERIGERFLPIYLLALGGTNFAIGALGGLQNLLGALYSLPGGWASDRWGHRRALVVFNLIALLGFVIVLTVPRWWAVLLGAAFFIAWSAVTLPAIMSLVGRVLPQHKRVTGVSLHSLVRRIPMALGPVVGGALIAGFGTVTGLRIAFGTAALLCLVGIALVLAFIPEDPPGVPKETLPPLRLFKRFDPALRSLLLSDILIRFCEQIPYAFVVVWAMHLHGITAMQFGVLTAIEMTTAALIYLPVARFADRGAKKPFVVITFIFFTAFPLVLLFSRSFPMLVVAFVLRGLKEFGEPTRKSMILDLAPADARAGGFFLWNMAPIINLLVATAFGALGTIWFAVYGKDLGRRNQPLHRS
ncbi:MAG: MFS transporter [Kiritimatiellaeota bacterium]|nr:MFS transporter [Kiritimatiellota bacterium]